MEGIGAIIMIIAITCVWRMIKRSINAGIDGVFKVANEGLNKKNINKGKEIFETQVLVHSSANIEQLYQRVQSFLSRTIQNRGMIFNWKMRAMDNRSILFEYKSIAAKSLSVVVFLHEGKDGTICGIYPNTANEAYGEMQNMDELMEFMFRMANDLCQMDPMAQVEKVVLL